MISKQSYCRCSQRILMRCKRYRILNQKSFRTWIRHKRLRPRLKFQWSLKRDLWLQIQMVFQDKPSIKIVGFGIFTSNMVLWLKKHWFLWENTSNALINMSKFLIWIQKKNVELLLILSQNCQLVTSPKKLIRLKIRKNNYLKRSQSIFTFHFSQLIVQKWSKSWLTSLISKSNFSGISLLKEPEWILKVLIMNFRELNKPFCPNLRILKSSLQSNKKSLKFQWF